MTSNSAKNINYKINESATFTKDYNSIKNIKLKMQKIRLIFNLSS